METTSQERTWAAIAHASTLVTLLFGVLSGGVGGIIFILVPMVIYLSFRDHSRFVAYHAAQAFALQLAATVGWLVAAFVGLLALILLWTMTGILSVVLVGILLIPVMLLVTLAYVAAVLVAPFVFGGYAIVGTVETSDGNDYSYPWIGDYVRNWVERRSRPIATA